MLAEFGVEHVLGDAKVFSQSDQVVSKMVPFPTRKEAVPTSVLCGSGLQTSRLSAGGILLESPSAPTVGGPNPAPPKNSLA